MTNSLVEDMARAIREALTKHVGPNAAYADEYECAEAALAVLKARMTTDKPTDAMLDAGEAAYDAVPAGVDAHRYALGRAYTAMHEARPQSPLVPMLTW